jgi:hypothetical protein
MVWSFSRTSALLASAAVVCGLHGVTPPFPFAADQTTAILLAKDALGTPNQVVTVEAKLLSKKQQGEEPAAGEPLELVQNGQVVATATTDVNGLARLPYRTKSRGHAALTVRVGAGSRLSATASATVAAWERRTPLLAVELAALLDDPASQNPIGDAAEELGKLAQFYYNVVYVVAETDGQADAFQLSARTREWLSTHKFPVGYVLVASAIDGALGKHIDELRSVGWTTLKVGVGRTKRFAEAFLERRLDAVVVPEPARGEVPRKAKIAKGWKDVRKKL